MAAAHVVAELLQEVVEGAGPVGGGEEGGSAHLEGIGPPGAGGAEDRDPRREGGEDPEGEEPVLPGAGAHCITV